MRLLGIPDLTDRTCVCIKYTLCICNGGGSGEQAERGEDEVNCSGPGVV